MALTEKEMMEKEQEEAKEIEKFFRGIEYPENLTVEQIESSQSILLLVYHGWEILTGAGVIASIAGAIDNSNIFIAVFGFIFAWGWNNAAKWVLRKVSVPFAKL